MLGQHSRKPEQSDKRTYKTSTHQESDVKTQNSASLNSWQTMASSSISLIPIQRKCERCEDENMQYKTELSMGTKDDHFEKEADKVANDIVNKPTQTSTIPITPFAGNTQARRKKHKLNTQAKPVNTNNADTTNKTKASEYLNNHANGGRALPSSENDFYSQRFGHSFDNVKIHTNNKANQAASSVNAKAFTSGNHIVFNDNQYKPHTDEGKRLLAHELTHVIQQGGMGSNAIQRDPEDNNQEHQNQTPENEAPQQTADPVLIDSALPSDCGDISFSGKQIIADFLSDVHTLINKWEKWRNQVDWDNPSVSSHIPDINPLLRRFIGFRGQHLPCENTENTMVPIENEAVRTLLFNGVNSVQGLSLNELDLMAEWMRYTGRQSNDLQRYLRLSPGNDIEHKYGLEVLASTSDDAFSIGLGAGGAVKTPLFSAEVGCYPELGVGGGYVIFKYSNNVGMKWEQGYAQANIELSGECAFSFSAGVAVSTSLGEDALCSGSSISSAPLDWYGPKDFSGATFSQGVGVGGSAGIGVDGGYSYLLVAPNNKKAIAFDTSGACTSFELGVGVTAEASVLNVGGQDPVGAVEGTLGRLDSSGAYSTGMDSTRMSILQRTLYFDTGVDDPQMGSLAMENVDAINDILSAIEQSASNNNYIQDVIISIVGHASPKYQSALNEEMADNENYDLAMRRAANSSLLIHEAVNRFPYGMPHLTILLDGTCEFGGAANDIQSETSSQGSDQGLRQTNDRNNNYQRYRKAEIQVYVNRLIDNNVIREDLYCEQ